MIIIRNDECRGYVDEFVQPLVHDHIVCTDNEEGIGACYGDYGNGLVSVDHGKLIGVSSWVVPCGLGTPDGYTRIAAYTDWITNITGIDFT